MAVKILLSQSLITVLLHLKLKIKTTHPFEVSLQITGGNKL